MAGLSAVRVTQKVRENDLVTTLRFDYPAHAMPGQFVMAWLPGVDEVPMSLSYLGDEKGITVKMIGEATKALASLDVGDRIGIRGPYGNGFSVDFPGKRVLIVGGGTGIAPLAALAENINLKVGSIFIAGAREMRELFMLDRIEDAADDLLVCTDDGSTGTKGFASDLAKEAIKDGIDAVLTCGPEPMMEKIIAAANHHKIPVQASLERHMKCGIGICDSCSINGYQVCKDGPVFNGKTLAQLDEFNKVKRTPSGREQSF
jgi:dihydroorotate dehydrogenase electron transfer subunit